MKKMVLGLFLLGAVSAFAEENATVLHFKDGVLVDSQEKTVYVYDEDTSADSTCYGQCAKAWPAVLEPQHSDPLPNEITVSVRHDGSHQLVYEGHPLYYYIGDKKAGDTKGDGLGGVWHIVNH